MTLFVQVKNQSFRKDNVYRVSYRDGAQVRVWTYQDGEVLIIFDTVVEALKAYEKTMESLER